MGSFTKSLFKHIKGNSIILDSRDHLYNSKVFGGALEGTDSAGGYTVPSPLANFFIDRIAVRSWMRQLIRAVPIDSKTLDIPIMVSGNSVYFGSEGYSMVTEGGSDQSSSSMGKIVWDQLTITPKKFHALTGYSTELEEDSALNIAQITTDELLRGISEAEQLAVMQGSTTLFSWTAGDVRKAFGGIINSTPGTNAGTGAKWTPPTSDSVADNWINAGSSKLTTKDILELQAKLAEQNGILNTIMVNPTVGVRLNDPIEFEQFQTIDKIGGEAANQRGVVGRVYGADVIVCNDLPTGVAVFNVSVSAPKDTLVLGFDKDTLNLYDRRLITMRMRYKFEEDVIEQQYTQRLTFAAHQKKLLAGLAQVQSAV